MQNGPVKVAVFCGGAGSRLWPVSRRSLPKQFQPLTGSQSLLRSLGESLATGFGLENICIFTGLNYVDLVAREIPLLPRENIIAEPDMRDTLAAVGYAAAVMAHRYPESMLVTLWGGDHLIRRPDTFVQALRAGCDVAKTQDASVMVDVTPTWPSPQLGYVEIGEKVTESAGFPAYAFKRFTEKPDRETAVSYVDGKSHLWNTGYFVWNNPSVLDLYEKYAPDTFVRLQRIMDAMDTPTEASVTAAEYREIPALSVDYGVFSHITPDHMLVIAADLGWADVGSWDVLRDELRDSPDANVIHTAESVVIDTTGSVLYSSTGKMIATIGLDNIIIVDTPDALLVARADRAQDVKKIVDVLRKSDKTSYL